MGATPVVWGVGEVQRPAVRHVDGEALRQAAAESVQIDAHFGVRYF